MNNLLLRRAITYRLFCTSKSFMKNIKAIQNEYQNLIKQTDRLDQLSKHQFAKPKQLIDMSKTIPQIYAKPQDKTIQTKQLSQSDKIPPYKNLTYEYLTSLRLTHYINLPSSKTDRTILILAPLDQQTSTYIPRIAVGSLSFLALYQIFTGMYSYYCILGTIGLTAWVYSHYVRSVQKKFGQETVLMAEILKTGIVNIQLNDSQIVSALPSEVIFLGNSIRVGNRRMKVPQKSIINFSKFAQISRNRVF